MVNRLGYEELHENEAGMYNEPSITGTHCDLGSGVAPKVRGSICAILRSDSSNTLYWLCEDDCQFFEIGTIKETDLPQLLKDLEELKSVTVEGIVGFSRSNRFAVERRKDGNDLVHFSISNFVMSFDVYWTQSIIEVVNKAINILKEENK
jgi:hypothetical protein